MTTVLAAHASTLIGLVAFFIASLWVFGRILAKAGYGPAWGLVMWLPVINLIAVWVFAFLDWPGTRDAETDAPNP